MSAAGLIVQKRGAVLKTRRDKSFDNMENRPFKFQQFQKIITQKSIYYPEHR